MRDLTRYSGILFSNFLRENKITVSVLWRGLLPIQPPPANLQQLMYIKKTSISQA